MRLATILLGASLLSFGLSETAEAQIDLTPPTPPARPAWRASPVPHAVAAAQGEPAQRERIDAESAARRIFELNERIAVCASEAEPVRRFSAVVELENDKCLESSVARLREIADQAKALLGSCPQVQEVDALRTELDEAIRELSRKRDVTIVDEAKRIYDGKIEALKRNDLIFESAEERLTELSDDILRKIVTIDEVVRACSEDVNGALQPPADLSPVLVRAAQEEGSLNTIALPRDWCGFGSLIDDFEVRYGVTVNELDPNANSAGQLDALRAGDSLGPANTPDVVEIGFSDGAVARHAGLFQPYRVAAWVSIPIEAKDADGYWYADYFGVIVFGINAAIVKEPPSDWPDLLGAHFRGSIALAGHPHRTNEAIQAIYSAGVAAAGEDTSLAGEAGLRFFADLHQRGNLVEKTGNALSLSEGSTPIVLRWDYAALTDRDKLVGKTPIMVVVPRSGRVAAPYVQAINVNAPHPNAARLWMEHLYSDEGQLRFLNAYCHPIRYQDLVRRGVIPSDLAARLPPAEAYENVVFPDPAQQGRGRATIFNEWQRVVGAMVE
jgi:putative spermidine/putrescine transport system substrate-binding protein